MWELIVMGQIPGTQFEVNFTMWLLIVVTPMSAWFLYRTAQSTRKGVELFSRSELFAAFRISYLLRTATDVQLLITRHHIQA